MKVRKPDTFETIGTPDTIAPKGNYSFNGTKSSNDMSEPFAQKSEISHIRELMGFQKEHIDFQIKDIKEALSSRETRFWVVNGIILASIITIFLAVLPDLYKKDNKEKFDSISETIKNLNKRIDSISKPIKK